MSSLRKLFFYDEIDEHGEVTEQERDWPYLLLFLGMSFLLCSILVYAGYLIRGFYP